MDFNNIFEEMTAVAPAVAVCTVASHCNALVENDFAWEEETHAEDEATEK